MITANLHPDTEKKKNPSWVSRMFGVHREFWAKIMEIKIRKLTLDFIYGAGKKKNRSRRLILRTAPDRNKTRL